MKVPFVKMHGNGNDFVIVDNTKLKLKYNKSFIKKLSSRRLGIGCDQFIILKKSKKYDIFMKIYNPNGEEAEMCGNAARCVASLLIAKEKKKIVKIETVSSAIDANLEKNSEISISIEVPEQNIEKIIRDKTNKSNVVNLKNINPSFKEGYVINMGNPHVVFFTKSLDLVDLDTFGKSLERNKAFINGINIEVVEVKSNNLLRVKFWERGAGSTLSCGSGILAAFYASYSKKKCNHSAKILLPLGSVKVKIKNNMLTLTGKAEVAYLGKFNYV